MSPSSLVVYVLRCRQCEHHFEALGLERETPADMGQECPTCWAPPAYLEVERSRAPEVFA